MKVRKIDNFATWRKKAKAKGIIRSTYPELQKNGDLAELIGVVLGDGHIGKFPRTESLTIVGTSTNKGFCSRYAVLMGRIFNQKPYLRKRTTSNATDIRIYQKYISQRLGIPTGARGKLRIGVPQWLLAKDEFVVRYLRGLFEAEGSLNFHPKTHTHKFIFTNCNQSLIRIVMRLLRRLGFHPHFSANKVQISRKDEVEKAVKVLRFREYNK